MKPSSYTIEELREKGYKESQCFLLRLGGMYIKKDEYESLNFAYVLFFLSIFGCFIVLLIPYSVAVAIPRGEMFVIFQDLHYWIIMTGYSSTSIMYHRNRKYIDNVLILIGKGFYTYYGEEYDGDVRRIIKSNQDNLKILTKHMTMFVLMCGVCVIAVPPVIEVLTVGVEIPEDAVLNPYLPLPLHTLWNQFTIQGYASIYLLMFTATVFVVLELLALSLGYTSFMLIYITQFKLLNLSILKMEQRATKRYLRVYKRQDTSRNKFSDPMFQECMHFCLKENIQHHQILIRWIKDAEKFLGWALLCTFFATSLLLATSGFLVILPNNSFLALAILIQVEVVELIHSFLFCWSGETVASESAGILRSLYSIPWFHCNKEFNKTLHIMMGFAMTPVVPRDPVLKLKASLEIYKSLISTAYTYFNVIRSTNKLEN